MPLWEMLARGKAWLELYRTVVIGEQKAALQIRKREARKARMQALMGGKGRRGR